MFSHLKPLSFDVVLADPPWLFELRSPKGEGKSPQRHYDCMTVDELVDMPVSPLCRGDALLFMWTTWPMIADGAALAVARAWGFHPVTGGAWFKRTSKGANWMGTGYVLRSACEPFIIGRMGSPLLRPQYGAIVTEDGLALDASIREHSRKPDLVYGLLERLCPRAMRGLELFARQRWAGQSRIEWEAWGNETDKFPLS